MTETKTATETEVSTAAQEEILHYWEYDIPLFGNRYLMGAIGLAFGIPLVLLSILVAVVAGKLLPGLVILVGLGVPIAAIILLVCLIVGRFHAAFAVTTRGVRYRAGKFERMVAGVTAAGGAVLGSASAAGAGLLALSDTAAFIAWEDAAGIAVDPKRRTVLVRRNTFFKPIRLYCSAADFEMIARTVEENLKARNVLGRV